MISIDQRKPQRLADTYRDYARSGVISVNYQLSLDHADLTTLVSMGPSSRHITPQALAARVRSLPSPFTVTVDLQIRVFPRRRTPRLVAAASGKR
jgi:23S rRNA (guanine745-N1)-methyltransferase